MKLNLWFIKLDSKGPKLDFFGKRYLMLVGAAVHLYWAYSIVIGI